MQIYPALDLKAGQCIRLYQGRFDQMTNYHDDPLSVVSNFIQQGADWMHIVDLDAAKDPEQSQREIIAKIAKQFNIKIQTGGGIRRKEQIEKLFDVGVQRVVIGSLAVKDPAMIKDWLSEFGKERIAIAFDVQIVQGKAYIATHGWQELSQYELTHVLQEYQSNLTHVLCTDIAKDGTLAGPNIHFYQQLLAEYPEINWQASGGVSSLDDLTELRACGVAGAIVGKALYEKRFTLEEALTC